MIETAQRYTIKRLLPPIVARVVSMVCGSLIFLLVGHDSARGARTQTREAGEGNLTLSFFVSSRHFFWSTVGIRRASTDRRRTFSTARER